jgi:hypothetical protein
MYCLLCLYGIYIEYEGEVGRGYIVVCNSSLVINGVYNILGIQTYIHIYIQKHISKAAALWAVEISEGILVPSGHFEDCVRYVDSYAVDLKKA